ncbi:MAG: DUF4381 domain-containing protein [Xanthomonadales bacterium]|nr:DUF4381 domain-containing protein [Gammaproteobacteria bacterium]MBT8051277.1 DUF4381 domain-containing protein [Gammaproteobacteria bacterium]NNJ80548.1 DUF4381 domain-containing protein [Xanthomonadales bacterium]NNK32707.1 DUF4381 domain-containing protein [Xanthomonadales bacterium]NNK37300.1 DUF4381 domain-containing protein [Xanthomonadales bacterium]
MNDPASLQNLNDIAAPAAVAWWPPAPGWYVLAGLALLGLLALLFRWLQRWQRSRYRREARAVLADVRASGAGQAHRVPELLKRAALSAFPRDQVAGLDGTAWYRFLDGSAHCDRFSARDGGLLAKASYGIGKPLSESEFVALCEAAEFWLRQHRIPGD